VIEEMKSMEDERRCWRMVGGVLVEKKVAEVLPQLKEHVTNVKYSAELNI
jgi:chaperonin cofactor prefoldin